MNDLCIKHREAGIVSDCPYCEIERLRAFVAWIVREFGAIQFDKKPSTQNVLELVQERHAAYLANIVRKARLVLEKKEAGQQ